MHSMLVKLMAVPPLIYKTIEHFNSTVDTFLAGTESIFVFSPQMVANPLLADCKMTIGTICYTLLLGMVQNMSKIFLKNFEICIFATWVRTIHPHNVIRPNCKSNFPSQACRLSKLVRRVFRIKTFSSIFSFWFLYRAISTVNGYLEYFIIVTSNISITPFDLKI